MKNIGHIQHLHSSGVTNEGVKLPSPSQLLDGEIAVNNNAANEVLAIRNSDGNITTFSSDNVIMPKIESIEQAINTSNAYVGVRGYGEVSPTLHAYSGTREGLNEILSHFKMGWFDGEGRLVRECAPCRISQSVDGNGIPINGSLKDASGNTCDLMVYVDTDLYVDRATIDGLKVYGSSHNKQQVMGLGLKPHKVGDKEAKRFETFGFTPHCAKYHDISGKTVGYSYCDGGHVQTTINSLMSSIRGLNKGGGYMGLYYEFYEVWLIAMYLELGTLNVFQQNIFGWGNTSSFISNQDNWCADMQIGGMGMLMNDGTYNSFYTANILKHHRYSYMLEPHRMIDAIVKGGFINDVGGTTLYYLDKDGNAVKAPSTVDVTRYDGIADDDTNRYFSIRNVKGCQGIADGAMSAVVSIYYKDSYTNESGITTNYIMKECHPIYRGFDFSSGFNLQLNGLHYVIRGSESSRVRELFYCESWKQVPTDVNIYKEENAFIEGDYNPKNIPLLVQGYNRSQNKEDVSGVGYAQACNYNKSFIAVETYGGNATTYECQFNIGATASYGSPLQKDGTYGVGQSVNGTLMGNDSSIIYCCFSPYCIDFVTLSGSDYSGAFSHPQIKLK